MRFPLPLNERASTHLTTATATASLCRQATVADSTVARLLLVRASQTAHEPRPATRPDGVFHAWPDGRVKPSIGEAHPCIARRTRHAMWHRLRRPAEVNFKAPGRFTRPFGAMFGRACEEEMHVSGRELSRDYGCAPRSYTTRAPCPSVLSCGRTTVYALCRVSRARLWY